MSSLQAFPLEILENVCWQLDDVASLRSIRLVCKDLSIIAARPLYDHPTIYANCDSFERLEAIAHHDTYSKYVRHLTYSANMFRYYQIWEESFETWMEQAVGLGLGLTNRARALFRSQMSDEQLRRAYDEWQRVTKSQGKLIRHDPAEESGDFDTSSQDVPANIAEIKRLSDCLGQFPKLKSIRWQCQAEDLRTARFGLEAACIVEEAPQLDSLPMHVQQTLVARDPYGSKHRHARQVLAIFGAMNFTPGLSSKLQFLDALELRGIESRQFLQLIRRDSEDWISPTLVNLKHLSVTMSPVNIEHSIRQYHVVNILFVEAFEMLFRAASKLESLRVHAGNIRWPKGKDMWLSPDLKQLDLGGMVASHTTWEKITEKLAQIQHVSLSFVKVYGVSDVLFQGSRANHPWAILVSSLLENSTSEQIKLWGSLDVCLDFSGNPVNYDAEVDNNEGDQENGMWSEGEEEEEDDEDEDEDDDQNEDEDEDEETDYESDEESSIENSSEDEARILVAATDPVQFDLTEESARQRFGACATHTGWDLRTCRFEDPDLEGLIFTRKS